jgi:DNA-damage-inducible protein J
MTTIQIRTDKKLKRSVQQILDDLGLDMSTAINMYLVQINNMKGIPFPILGENGFLPEEEDRILKEIQETRKGKNYASAKELHEDILGG